jgi:hypothetical protein
MKTEIKIKPFNGKFDLFITINSRVIHCESFHSVADIEIAAPALLDQAMIACRQAEACESSLNAALGKAQ